MKEGCSWYLSCAKVLNKVWEKATGYTTPLIVGIEHQNAGAMIAVEGNGNVIATCCLACAALLAHKPHDPCHSEPPPTEVPPIMATRELQSTV